MLDLRRLWRFGKALFTGKLDEIGTPLQTAAFNGDVKRVRTLLDTGTSVDEMSKPSRLTPLAMAIFAGRVEVVRLLLERGADTNGSGVVDALAFAERQGRTQVVDLLAQAGAESARIVISQLRRTR